MHPFGKKSTDEMSFRRLWSNGVLECWSHCIFSLLHHSDTSIRQPVTSVPTFSPMTTRRKLCGLKKSKTMMGILLSMQSENAVESITLSRRCNASRYVICEKRLALGFFFGSES